MYITYNIIKGNKYYHYEEKERVNGILKRTYFEYIGRMNESQLKEQLKTHVLIEPEVKITKKYPIIEDTTNIDRIKIIQHWNGNRFFHGSDTKPDIILKEGLNPNTEDYYQMNRKGVFVTTDLDVAQRYGKYVYELRLPKSRYLLKDDTEFNSWIYPFKIPKERITEY